MKGYSLILLLNVFLAFYASAQFHPAAGISGSHAISQNHGLIKSWAQVEAWELGWLDIRDTALGKPTVGDSASASGLADGNVLSLGDGGWVTLIFNEPISDQEGYDFAVFENSFRDDFLELAFVEVSSDGAYFARFPASSLSSTNQQVGSFGLLDATKINNLAGKYRGGYGVPFDLSELANDSLLNLDSIRFVRIIDVVGSIDPQWGSIDAEGRLINDPFPTPFPSGGFDLDAVAVLTPGYTSNEPVTVLNQNIQIYPNPISHGSTFQIAGYDFSQPLNLMDTNGRIVSRFAHRSDLFIPSGLSSGIYILQGEIEGNLVCQKIILR